MASFFDLPGEIRNLIYETILDAVFIQEPQTPWERLPERATYLSLLLSNKKVGKEIQSLFDTHYATEATLYFDNVKTLIKYYLERERYPAICNARFSVRKISLDIGSKTDGKGEMKGPIAKQPGFKTCEWMPHIDWYRTEPTRQNYRLHPGPPPYVRPDWVPEEHGFRHSEDRNAQGCVEGRRTCTGFKKLEYPILQNGCKVTAYSWHTQSHGRHSTESGSMVLEGRLKDLVFG